MENKAYVALFVSIVSVSFASIFIVSIQKNVPSLSIAFYRLFFTTILIMPLVFLRSKTRKELFSLPRYTIFIMVIIGFVLAAHFALWITSLKLTSVASSVILVTAHTLLVGPVSHFLFKEKLSFLNAFGISLSVSGVFILVYGNY